MRVGRKQSGMGTDAGKPAPPSELSTDFVERVDDLDEDELRALIDYAHERKRYLHPTVTEQIEPGPGEEIVRVDEQEGYTEVVKREPCGEDCPECPHGPYLYHVREQQGPDGDPKLQWNYLGPVDG